MVKIELKKKPMVDMASAFLKRWAESRKVKVANSGHIIRKVWPDDAQRSREVRDTIGRRGM